MVQAWGIGGGLLTCKTENITENITENYTPMAENPHQKKIKDPPITLRRKAEGHVWTARINLPTKLGRDKGRIEKSTKKNRSE